MSFKTNYWMRWSRWIACSIWPVLFLTHPLASQTPTNAAPPAVQTQTNAAPAVTNLIDAADMSATLARTSPGNWLRPKPDSAAIAITGHARTTLSLDSAIAIALARNPLVLRAITEIERQQGVVIEARAAAYPHVSLGMNLDVIDEYLNPGPDVHPANTLADDSGGTITLPSPGGPITMELPGSSSGQPPNTDKSPNESWQIEIRITKSLYNGGATRASIAQAKLIEEAIVTDFQEICLETILEVRRLFYDTLFQRGRIVVEEESVALLREDLQDQTRRFDAGTVPRFNVLRAEVAVFNELPKLIEAKNAYRNSLDRLAKILAIDYPPGTGEEFTPFSPTGELDKTDRNLVLAPCINQALIQRPLLVGLNRRIEAERQGIIVARAGWLPRFDAHATYRIQNDPFWDNLDRTDSGYLAGIAGQWDIFDGFATLGRVRQGRQQTRSAELQFEDDRRQVELDTRVAYSRYIASLEYIRSQEKNVELAAESLRLARSRFDSGAGTQLDVLDARVQLTQAALNELNARYQYQLALAEMDRAIAAEVQFICASTNGKLLVPATRPVAATTIVATEEPSIKPCPPPPAPSRARKPTYESKPR